MGGIFVKGILPGGASADERILKGMHNGQHR